MMPFGEWVYFFTVKIHDYDWKKLRGLVNSLPSADRLRTIAQDTPSLENRIRYAQSLHDKGEYRAAEELFAEVLRQDDEDRDALYGLGLCKVGVEEFHAATRELRKLIELEPAHADYEPWFELALAYWKGGLKEDAIQVLMGTK